jgi:hypothetical protein
MLVEGWEDGKMGKMGRCYTMISRIGGRFLWVDTVHRCGVFII